MIESAQWLLAAAAVLSPAVRAPRADSFPRLVTPQWVAAERRRADVVLLHVDRSRAEFDSVHAGGAQFVATTEFTTTRDGILTELPATADLVSLVERLGISNRSEVVLYGDVLSAARLFVTLDYLGHDRVALLDGGLTAWRAAGLPTTTDGPTAGHSGQFVPSVRIETIATTTWVRDHLEDPTVKLLDARSPAEYSGEQGEEGVSRPGHIPGAALLDWHTLVEGPRLKPAEQLRALVRAAGVEPGRTTVTYCRVGTRASLLYFVLRYLDLPVRLYDGSLNEWSSRPELPVVRGPAPQEQVGRSQDAIWETVVVKREPATGLAEYRAHLGRDWVVARDQARARGLVLEYRILTGQAQPDDLLAWDVVLVTVFRNAESRRRFQEEQAVTDADNVEGPSRRLARRQYVTILREP